MAKPIRVVALVAVAALGLAACGGSSSGGSGGSGGGKTLIISSDLPLQGSSKDASEATNNAIELYLESVGNKAGDYTIKFQKYDDSTAAAAKWDSGQCQKNATAHVQNADEVAVMGTYNSGCAKIQVPILNPDPKGPMLMVSQANTNPGLTKKWEAGEPEKFYPKGTRNYARVVTTDDVQGQAAATFVAQDLGIKKVYILNDNETYGQGVAKQFEDSAKAAGVTVLGNEAWDAKATNYTALFQKIKAAGADAVYLGGIFDSNGGQLVKDKVAVLGDNAAVKLMGPDGFTGYPALNKMPEAQGMYLTFPGLSTDQLRAKGGPGAKLLDSYKAKYNADPASSYALYGVAAVQVILAAIEKSDGTRKGVNDAVFTGEGISIPAATSVLGKDVKIDPKTGDVNVKDITVEVLKGNAETFLKAISVA
jgi:branched-chain amino acid transport system substrate-binding protein